MDGFVISSPTWLPRFCPPLSSFSLSLHLTQSSFLSLHSLSLSLSLLFSSLPSLSLFTRSLSQRLLSPLLSGTRACVTGGGDFSFLSSLLVLFFSSLHREREKSLLPLSLSFSLLLFFLSLSPSLPRPRVSLSLATEISVAAEWIRDRNNF